MKQQSTAKQPSVVATDAPEHPRFPTLKTIGGAADAQAIEAHNRAVDEWYTSFRSHQQSQTQSMLDRLDALEKQLSTLQKQPANVIH